MYRPKLALRLCHPTLCLNWVGNDAEGIARGLCGEGNAKRMTEAIDGAIILVGYQVGYRAPNILKHMLGTLCGIDHIAHHHGQIG